MYATVWVKFEYINYEKNKHKSHVSHDTISSTSTIDIYTEICMLVFLGEERKYSLFLFWAGGGGGMKMFWN